MTTKSEQFINFTNIFLFVLSFITLSFTDTYFISKGVSNIMINLVKYIFLILGIFLAFINLILLHRKKIYIKETIVLVINFLIFLSYTIFLFIINNKIIEFESIFSLSYLFLSAIYSYLLINILDFKVIYNSLVIILIISMFNFVFFEKGIELFTIKNILSSSFNNSFSLFESHYSSGVAFALCLFFTYFNKNRFFTLLSLFYVFLTFKRILLISSIFLFLFTIFFCSSRSFKRNYLNVIMSIIFTIAPLIYFNILVNDSYGLFDFTLGRSVLLNNLINSEYISYGYNSSNVFLNGKGIEMDLIRIYLELGFFSLFIFSFCYWLYAGRNIYSLLSMFFIFLNLLFSHSLGSVFTWIIFLVTISSININSNEFHRKRFL